MKLTGFPNEPDQSEALIGGRLDLGGTTPELVKKTAPISTIKDVPFTNAGLKLLDGTKNFLVDEKLADNNFELNDWILKQ